MQVAKVPPYRTCSGKPELAFCKGGGFVVPVAAVAFFTLRTFLFV